MTLLEPFSSFSDALTGIDHNPTISIQSPFFGEETVKMINPGQLEGIYGRTGIDNVVATLEYVTALTPTSKMVREQLQRYQASQAYFEKRPSGLGMTYDRMSDLVLDVLERRDVLADQTKSRMLRPNERYFAARQIHDLYRKLTQKGEALTESTLRTQDIAIKILQEKMGPISFVADPPRGPSRPSGLWLRLRVQ